jgi:hypothetical protein
LTNRKILLKTIALRMILVLALTGCTSASTPESVRPIQSDTSSQATNTPVADMPLPADAPYTVAEVEKLAGFDVKEPAYLPTGVTLDFATYQKSPHPTVILHFKLVHETYGDMGSFFQIVQEPQAEALPDPTACGVSGNDCEIVQIGERVLQYRLNGQTELLMWKVDGFSFHLLRTAGEPNKIYKDELLKVAGSME